MIRFRSRAKIFALSSMVILCAAAGSLVSRAAFADDWPSRPVRIVNTFAAGGAADFLARVVADHLSSVFNQQFYVETRAGAGGKMGMGFVANSDPDGYNFAVSTPNMLFVGPMLGMKMGYDPARQLTNVAYLAGSPIVFMVSAQRGIKTLPDLLAFQKSSGKSLTYSSSGNGSSGNLIAEAFALDSGMKVEHVPYKGAAQGITDVIGGHIDFGAQTVGSGSGFIRGGQLIPLALTASQRMPDYPDIPTFKELGYPAYTTGNWFGLAGPAGLPPDIVDKMNREVGRALTKPETTSRLAQDGLVAMPMTPEVFAKFIADETTFWKTVVDRVGMKLNE